MADVVKRHWLLFVLNATAIAALLAVLLLPPMGGARSRGGVADAAPNLPAVAQEVMAIDPASYSRVEGLREELCVTNGDLAAYGCNQQVVDHVLVALREWHDLNRPGLEQSIAARRRAIAALRDKWQKIHVGPKDQGSTAQLSVLEQQRSQIEEHHRQLLQAAVVTLSSHLSHAQAQAWSTARTNVVFAEAQGGMASRFRYVPGLTANQARSIKQGGAGAAGVKLLGVQELALVSAIANQRANMAGALAATKRVLPRPAELRE